MPVAKMQIRQVQLFAKEVLRYPLKRTCQCISLGARHPKIRIQGICPVRTVPGIRAESGALSKSLRVLRKRNRHIVLGILDNAFRYSRTWNLVGVHCGGR